MPQSLAPVPLSVPVVEEDRSFTVFMRERWQQLIDSFTRVPTVATPRATDENAAIATTAAYTTRSAGLYEVSWYVRKTTADGVSSSVTVTLGWTHNGTPLTESGAALTLDTTSAQQSGSKLVYADASTDITYSTSYSSNTPGAMHYELNVAVKQLA